MVRASSRWLAASFASLAISAAASALPPSTGPTTAPATQPAADVSALIRQLGDDDFRVRMTATRDLKAAGKAALPALLEARKSQDPEVQAKVEEILAELNRPPIDESAVPQPGPGGAGMMSSSTSVVNGARTVDVKEPGRSIHIEEKPGALYMKVEGQLDGQPATREYKATSAAELKEKHPKAFALYQQYNNNGVRVGFGNGGFNVQGNVIVQNINVHGGAVNVVVGVNAAPPNIREIMNVNRLNVRLMMAMREKAVPDAQQKEVHDLIAKLRQAIPDPQKAGKEKEDQQHEYQRLGDAVRSKIAELKLGDFDAMLPERPKEN
jgi:hypothetical protein